MMPEYVHAYLQILTIDDNMEQRLRFLIKIASLLKDMKAVSN